MRNIMLVIVAVLTIAAAPQKRPSVPPTLWTGITDGMPVATILAKNPGAAETNGEIVLRAVTVDGLTYHPTVKTIDGKASQVILTPERGNTRDFLTALSVKYGEPVQQWDCIDRFGAVTCSAVWRGARGLRVTLGYMGVFGEGSIAITYKIASSQGL